MEKEYCNCAWPYCTAHPNGQDCYNVAESKSCTCGKHEGSIVYLGDEVLGEGVRLCLKCAESISELLNEDIMKLMQDINDGGMLSTASLRLEEFLRRNTEMVSDTIIDDRSALIEFILMAAHVPDNKITVDILERACRFMEKLTALGMAFGSINLEKAMK